METGLEPATTGTQNQYSTIELLLYLNLKYLIEKKRIPPHVPVG
jgi:hypothetical protein